MNTEEIAKDMTEGPVFAAAGDICNTDCLGKCAAGYIQHGGHGGSRTGCRFLRSFFSGNRWTASEYVFMYRNGF